MSKKEGTKTWEPEAIKRCAERLLISPENFSAQETMRVALGAHSEHVCPAGKHGSVTAVLQEIVKLIDDGFTIQKGSNIHETARATVERRVR